MKVLIVSDSHGLTNELTIIKDRHSSDVDALIHCGDSELEHTNEEISEFITVRGNCDFDSFYDDDIAQEIANERIFVTHGHLYNVKMTLMNLYYQAKEINARIVCYGHSHIASAEFIDGILFINPGSIRLPRMSKEKTYVILEMKDEVAFVRFYNLDGFEQTNLSKKIAF